MVRGEPLNTRTAGTDITTSTPVTLLRVIRTQHYMWSLGKGGCSSNSKIVPTELLLLMAKYTLLLTNL